MKVGRLIKQLSSYKPSDEVIVLIFPKSDFDPDPDDGKLTKTEWNSLVQEVEDADEVSEAEDLVSNAIKDLVDDRTAWKGGLFND